MRNDLWSWCGDSAGSLSQAEIFPLGVNLWECDTSSATSQCFVVFPLRSTLGIKRIMGFDFSWHLCLFEIFALSKTRTWDPIAFNNVSCVCFMCAVFHPWHYLPWVQCQKCRALHLILMFVTFSVTIQQSGHGDGGINNFIAFKVEWNCV